ncbi:MAG: hypothetical protein ACJAVX_001149 [Pseudoalteromonas rhizosphaerae]
MKVNKKDTHQKIAMLKIAMTPILNKNEITNIQVRAINETIKNRSYFQKGLLYKWQINIRRLHF